MSQSNNTSNNTAAAAPAAASAGAPAPAGVAGTASSFMADLQGLQPPPYAPLASAVDLANNRPSLPDVHRNPYLHDLPADVHLVKFQTIVRENKEIIVGRVKVPIPGPSHHAFILRRYDTDAISLTTMFKVAFPGSSEEDEKREEEWVKSNFDTRGTNGGRDTEYVRLAGQWISRHLALHLAPAYNVPTLIAALARAVPDPTVAYRKSQRSVAAQENYEIQRRAAANAAATGRATMSVNELAAVAPPVKRPRQSAEGGAVSAASAGQSSAGPAAATTPAGSRTFTLEATTTITAPVGVEPHMDAEIAAAKQLVLDLKNELRLRNAAGTLLTAEAGPSPAAAAALAAGGSRPSKRSAADQDDAVVIPSGAGAPGEARVIRRNKRIEVQGGTTGQTAKKVAWSALVFGLGFAASSLLPSFASAYL